MNLIALTDKSLFGASQSFSSSLKFFCTISLNEPLMISEIAKRLW